MYYKCSDGNFYNEIAISKNKNWSIREVNYDNPFFILTISKDIQDSHLEYANEVLIGLQKLGVKFMTLTVDEGIKASQSSLIEEYRRNRDLNHSYFVLSFISGPIPLELLKEWNNKIDGIDGIPSIDCKWR